MSILLNKLSDEELQNLASEVLEEQKRRKALKMSDEELYKIAKAKNGEYSDDEALFALSIMLKREKPNLQLIATLKKMSYSDAVRDECGQFLFGK